MRPTRDSPALMRRFNILFLAACILLVTYFHMGRGANASSRLLTVFGLVEHHTLVADDWKSTTGDYARIKGHTYSDKAPMASMLLAPFYWIWRWPFSHPISESDMEAANHIGLVLVGALPFAIVALLCLYRVRRNGIGPHAAVWLALAGAFGTNMANYGACFFGHMLAAAFFLGAYVLAVEQERRWVLAGFLGGCAVLTEYPLVLTQFITVIYLLRGPERWGRALRYCLGALPLAIAMVVYNKLVTGKLFDFPYSHVSEEWATMRTFFGIRMPSLDAAWELTFGQYRGLACYCPALLLLVPMIWSHFDGPRRRRNLVLALLGTYLVFIASYFKWDGGWATGPRHLVPLVALAVYEGLGALSWWGRGYGWFAGLSGWGIAVSTAASATNPLPDESSQHPVFEVFFKKVAAGELTPHILLKEVVHLPNGSYLMVVWATLFGLLALVLGWYLARQVSTAEALSLAGGGISAGGIGISLDEARRRNLHERWVYGALAGGGLALLIGMAVSPPDLAKDATWRSSSAFAPDHWLTSGSAKERGPYHLMFHTGEQDSPWVILDLHATRTIHTLAVRNREDCCEERAVPLIVEASTDDTNWVQVAEKKEVFDGWTAQLPTTQARYLRLRVPRKTLLHLQDVSVY